jgi:hypothetical protein
MRSMGFFGLIGLIALIGFFGLIGLLALIGFFGLIGLFALLVQMSRTMGLFRHMSGCLGLHILYVLAWPNQW